MAITGFTAEKKGRTEYFVPVFESLTVAPADLSAAQALDEGLQEYLNAAPKVDNEPEPAHSAPAQASFTDEPPF